MKSFVRDSFPFLISLAILESLVFGAHAGANYLKRTGQTEPAVGAISSIGVLPNPKLTPGATNPDITQATIGKTICNPQWSTSSIRPPVSYTTPLKRRQMVEYGYSDTNTADYEEDHLISLELGGSPTAPENLWPEPYQPVPGARQKDQVENYLHKQVCSGAMKLVDAQAAIRTNWYKVYQMMKGTLGSSEGYADEDDDSN